MALADIALRHIQPGNIHIVVCLSVCDCRLEQLLKNFTRGLGRVLENCHGLISGLITDQIQNNLHLARRNAHVRNLSHCFHV